MYRIIRVRYLRILGEGLVSLGLIFFIPVGQSSAHVPFPWLNFGGAVLDGSVRHLSAGALPSPAKAAWVSSVGACVCSAFSQPLTSRGGREVARACLSRTLEKSQREQQKRAKGSGGAPAIREHIRDF